MKERERDRVSERRNTGGREGERAPARGREEGGGRNGAGAYSAGSTFAGATGPAPPTERAALTSPPPPPPSQKSLQRRCSTFEESADPSGAYFAQHMR